MAPSQCGSVPVRGSGRVMKCLGSSPSRPAGAAEEGRARGGSGAGGAATVGRAAAGGGGGGAGDAWAPRSGPPTFGDQHLHARLAAHRCCCCWTSLKTGQSRPSPGGGWSQVRMLRTIVGRRRGRQSAEGGRHAANGCCRRLAAAAGPLVQGMGGATRPSTTLWWRLTICCALPAAPGVHNPAPPPAARSVRRALPGACSSCYL